MTERGFSETTYPEELFPESVLDHLVSPLVDIIRYYPDRVVERRILFYVWVANLFKPVAAVEASKILGYSYPRVHSLFGKLSKSSVLVKVDDTDDYCRVGSDKLPLYVRKDVITGRKLTGRPPNLYVFKDRIGIDMDIFVARFNQNGNQIWQLALSKVLSLLRNLDSSYRDALLVDCLFICDRLKPVIWMLQCYGTIFIERKSDDTDVKVHLRRETANYRIPNTEPFVRFV